MKVILFFFWMVFFFILMLKCGDEVVKGKREFINFFILVERYFVF